MVLYASDLDRTLIFSHRFLEEYPCKDICRPVEIKDDSTVISYMSTQVYRRLHEIKENEKVVFVPVTTRSMDEYNRVDLGFTPKYAIIDNGGTILDSDNNIITEYNDYVKSKIDFIEMAKISMDIVELFKSVDYEPKVIDGKYIFFKTKNTEIFDEEASYLNTIYPNWTVTRQRNKCYVVPNHFSKQIALRWLWYKLNKPYIVASGDSELDLPMLALAQSAVVPDHGSLYKDKIVLDGNIITGGVTSSLETMKIVEDKAKVY